MFDNVKARIARLEETNENFRTVVEHLQENQMAYTIGAACLFSGFITGKRFQRPLEVEVKPVFNNTFVTTSELA